MAGFGAKVKLTVDKSGKKNFNEQINSMVNQIKISNKFTILQKDMDRVRREAQTMLNKEQIVLKVKKIDCSAAITDVKKQLQGMLSSLSVSNGVNVTGLKDFLGTDGISQALKETAEGANAAVDKMVQAKTAATQWSGQMKVLDSIAKSLSATYRSGLSGKGMITDNDTLKDITSDYSKWQQKIEEVRSSQRILHEDELRALQEQGIAIQQKITTLQNEQVAQARAAAEAKKKSDAERDAARRAAENSEEQYASAKRLSAVYGQMNRYLQSNSKLSSGKLGDAIRIMMDEIKSGAPMTLDRLREIEVEFSNIKTQASQTGQTGRSALNAIANAYQRFGGWALVTRSMMAAVRSIKNMVTNVRELDAAMTELRKVTEATDIEYEKFFNRATTRAKHLGATIIDTINASADFARLGYTMDEAADLADTALVYKNVGDGIEAIGDASESVISTMKAFNIEASNSMFIVDKFNEVGNNFAISSKGVGDALLRSASAMAAANNTLDETIALITAANSVVQDPEKVGTTLKTVSMFLRAAKTEADEAGESTDGMANSVSELREELLSLTGGKVDIQIDADSFKSTYQIMKELSKVWGELTDVSRANILEMIGGKRNSNVVSSIISNFSIAEDVLETSANAAGSALAENEKYLDSINGKVAQLKAEFEELSITIFDSNFTKDAVDFAAILLEILNTFAELNALLPITASLITAILTMRRVNEASSITNGVVNAVVSGLAAESAEVKDLAASYSALTAARQNDVVAMATAQLMQRGFTREEATAKIATLGLTAATTGQTTANYSLATSFKAVLLSNPVGWIMLAISLLPALISGIKSLHKSNEEIIQDGRDLESSYNNGFSKLSDDLSTLRGLEDEFYRLSKGVDDYGGNISLAADDYERYQDIVSTILGISPSLIAGYDAEGNAIANKNGLLQKSIDLMEQERRLRLDEATSDGSIVKIGMGRVTDIRKYQEENKLPYGNAKWEFGAAFRDAASRYAKDAGKYEGQIYDAINPDNIDVGEFWSEGYWAKYGDRADSFAKDYYEKIVDALRSNRSILEDYFTQDDIDGLLEIAAQYDKNMAAYNSRMEEYSKQFNPYLQLVPQTLTSYSELTEGQKEFLTQYINNFRIAADTTEEDIIQMKQDILDFTDFISGNEGLRKSIDLGMSIKYGDGLTVSDYQKRVDELTKQINSYDDDVKTTIKVSFGIDTDASELRPEVEDAIDHVKNLLKDEYDRSVEQMSVSDALKIYYNISAVPNSMTLDELEQRMAKLADADDTESGLNSIIAKLADIESAFGDVSKALQQFSEDGSATAETLASMSKNYSTLESFENFVKIMSDASSSMDDVQRACNALAEEYLSTTNILDNVTEGNASVVESLLSEMGVTNAHELVLARLNAKRLEAALAANGLSKATWEEAENFLRSSGATESAIAALKSLRQEQYNAKLSSIDLCTASEDVIRSLMTQAAAAGVAADSLKDAIRLKNRFESGHASFYEIEHYDDLMASYANKAKANIADIGTINVPVVNVNMPRSSSSRSGAGSKSSTSSKTKEIEEYTVEIDKHREALERLNRAQQMTADAERRLGYEDDLKKKILLQRELILSYQQEQEALHSLNNQRDNTINDGVKSLRELGFTVEYNAGTNKLWIENLEHLNELTAISQGEYDTMQEATNALRKDTEDLIRTLTDLNDENRDGSNNWHDLRDSIKSSREEIHALLNEIVTQASDSVDSIQSVYDALHSAADEYAKSGYIAVDTLQSIISLGTEYMAYLVDENGQLVINEERIKNVIAARTEQLAVENALSYIEALRIAQSDNDIETLNKLLNATESATDATWGYVYASLSLLHLSGEQNKAAIHNINAIRAMADSAINGIGKAADSLTTELENMRSGMDDILGYVMDMIRQGIDDQVDALEREKDAYSDLISMKKESLTSAKEEAGYKDNVKKKLAEIAKLQERIDQLSLNGSRDAQAQKIALEEEMAELQKELADAQADHALDAQQGSLDKMQDAYEKQKDDEIRVLKDSISSYQKLYDMAIDYISDNWDSLYDELIGWNTEYGDVLNSDITSAWDNCLAAAQRYGDYVTALNSIGADIESSNSGGGSGGNFIIGDTEYDSSFTSEEGARAAVNRMKENSALWSAASPSKREALERDNKRIAQTELPKYGVYATLGGNGVWYLPDGRKLYDVYHNGGVAGNQPTLKQNEVMAILEKGEPVLDKKKEAGLYRIIDFTTTLSEKFRNIVGVLDLPSLFGGMRTNFETVHAKSINNVSGERAASIQFGNVYIYGGSDETVEKHREVNRQFANEIMKQLNIKR